jgi:anti-sigma factor RsiW
MTQRDLNEEWAFSQLEAWADGSLTGEARARLDAAIAADPLLAAAAERAVAVRRALRGSPRLPMPRGLRGRLLAIPRGSPRAQSFALPAFASAAAALAALAVVAGVLWLEPEPPPVTIDPRVVEAAEDLETAMRYLQIGAQITQAHVTSAVGTGLRDAFVASRNALAEETDENGG